MDWSESFAKVSERIRLADLVQIVGRNGAYRFSISDDGSLELRRGELTSTPRIANT